MKKVHIVMLVLFLFSTMLFAVDSFRNSATAGTIDDKLDLIYDPIDLKFVEGFNLYTNLSNLTSENEELFNNIADNEFLLGVSMQNPFVQNLWNSILITFENSQVPNNFNLINGNGWGNASEEVIDFIWDGVNDVYGFEDTEFMEKTDINTNDTFDFITNNTLDLGNFTVGARIAYSDNQFTDDVSSTNLGTTTGPLGGVTLGDATFEHNTDSYDLIDEEFLFEVKEKGTFESLNKDNNFNILTAIMFPEIIDFEVRGEFGINFMNLLNENNNDYTGSVDQTWNPIEDIYEETYQETDNLLTQIEQKGSELLFGGLIRKVFTENDNRLDQGFWSVRTNLGFGSSDYTSLSDEQFTSTDFEVNIYEEVKDYSTIEEETGTLGSSNIVLAGRVGVPLTEKAHFGIGCGINRNSTNRETDYSFTINNETTYIDYADGGPTNNDFKRTTTYSATSDKTLETVKTRFSVPVGVEYKVDKNKKWSIRFGSLFTNTTTTTNEELKNIEEVPAKQVTEYGGGLDDSIVYPYGQDYELVTFKEESQTTTSTTTFKYGLGYKPLDNLQIDLLCFLGNDPNSLLDANFYRNLRLSFTFNF